MNIYIMKNEIESSDSPLDDSQRNYFLSEIPKPYLLVILKNLKKNKEEWKQILGKELAHIITNYENVLKSLKSEKLREIIIKYTLLKDDEIKRHFLQFKDSQNPTFLLYRFRNSFEEYLPGIEQSFILFFKDKILNAEGIFEKDRGNNTVPNEYFRNFIVNPEVSFHEKGIVEINFEYS